MATRQTYVVWAPADTKPEVLERRTAVLRDHLKNIARLAKEGTLKLGGPMAEPVSGDSSGSLLVLEAESLEAVREIVQNDPFWTGDVWNKEKVEIKTVSLTIVGARQGKAKA
ncbi:hypothetical protein V8E53_002298 [Lactarius tabidus]